MLIVEMEESRGAAKIRARRVCRKENQFTKWFRCNQPVEMQVERIQRRRTE